MYSCEDDMYPDVRNWLEHELKSKFHEATLTRAYITSRMSLTKLLESEGLTRYFSAEYLTYDIMVDVTGVIVIDSRGELILVECKLHKITLRDLSQLLGYSIVARPLYSLIISPEGASDSLRTLIESFGREDILEYMPGRKIAIARWNAWKKDIDYMNIIPRGWSFR